ncbi:protein of unknown function (plasmid) [Caballeronia sp. S22]
MPAARGTRLSVALIGPNGLGSRTVCRTKCFDALVQHEIASAQRYALPLGMRGQPSEKKHTQTRLTERPRSGPQLFRAEPVTQAKRCVRPCASQAR